MTKLEGISVRQQIALNLADVIIQMNMTRPFGGDVTRSRDKRAWDILFSMPGTLDGMVRVFSPKFILIMCTGRFAPTGDWKDVYTNEADAVLFLQSLARRDMKTAMNVPTRVKITDKN